MLKTKVAALLGRMLFAALFVSAAPAHFSQEMIAMATQQGVPFALLLVPLSGLLAMAGGLSILVGFRARIGAALIVIFLLPVTLAMHRFWAAADPMTMQLHLVMFMKNLALAGGALFIAAFGAGPLSLDAQQA